MSGELHVVCGLIRPLMSPTYWVEDIMCIIDPFHRGYTRIRMYAGKHLLETYRKEDIGDIPDPKCPKSLYV